MISKQEEQEAEDSSQELMDEVKENFLEETAPLSGDDEARFEESYNKFSRTGRDVARPSIGASSNSSRKAAAFLSNSFTSCGTVPPCF